MANGYFDLATPFFATEYTAHVSMDFFDAGHMMYIHLPSLEKVRSDLAKFIAGAVPTT